MNNTNDLKFDELVANNNYEIAFIADGYYIIRKKGTTKPLKIGTNNDGYQYVHLNGKQKLFHRVIAKQYLPNPDNLPEVDHIDQNRSNNKLVNLRWASKSDNQKNKSGHCDITFEYVDELSDDAIEVDEYGKHQFEFLYFDDDNFYFFNGVRYRVLQISTRKDNGALFIRAYNTENKRVQIYLNKFKKLYGLI